MGPREVQDGSSGRLGVGAGEGPGWVGSGKGPGKDPGWVGPGVGPGVDPGVCPGGGPGEEGQGRIWTGPVLSRSRRGSRVRVAKRESVHLGWGVSSRRSRSLGV